MTMSQSQCLWLWTRCVVCVCIDTIILDRLGLSGWIVSHKSNVSLRFGIKAGDFSKFNSTSQYAGLEPVR